MCTLAIAFQAREGALLAVTANRDESYDRRSLPPAVENGVLAPTDLAAGGTWLGFTSRGLFVGVTNRAGGPRDPARRSRGLLVRDALAAPDARSLHAHLSSLRADHYNGFHLVYADREAAFVTWSDGDRVTQEELAPGVHVYSERSFGAGPGRAEPRVQQSLAALLASQPPALEALRDLVRFHAPPDAPFDAPCVHVPDLDYGTRSSFQLIVPAEGAPSASWTEGPPCTSPPRDLSDLIGGLQNP